MVLVLTSYLIMMESVEGYQDLLEQLRVFHRGFTFHLGRGVDDKRMNRSRWSFCGFSYHNVATVLQKEERDPPKDGSWQKAKKSTPF